VTLAAAGCTRGESTRTPARGAGATHTVAAGPAQTPTAARSNDEFVLRVPLDGGVPRVTAYPRTDSTVWTASGAAPALASILGFDADAGLIAAVDRRGVPLWIDLHAGTVSLAARTRLHSPATSDGSVIYGVGADGAVARFTPTGNSVFHFPRAARAVYPQASGDVLILAGRGAAARLWRIHPPRQTRTDSLAVPDAEDGTPAPTGDPIYFPLPKRRLVGVRTRPLQRLSPISFRHAVIALAATPSGDRFYVVTDSAHEVSIVDRYQNRVTATVALPGQPRDLRVDPLGRWVLVRATRGDAVWCIGTGTDRLDATVRSVWRADLPFVAPNGDIAVGRGRDVVFVDPLTSAETGRTPDGLSEFWYPFTWDGFRPRAAALDQPVQFGADSDSARAAATRPADSASSPPPTPAARAPVDSAKLGFTVSFAALLSETTARQRAAAIVVNGQAARVVTSNASGTPVYRVVLGPYLTRQAADAAGQASGQSYYVYPGPP
jgi:hypothetical protein